MGALGYGDHGSNARETPLSFSDFIVFVDESGDHSMTSIDPAYPIFVLSFCVVRKDVYVDVLSTRVRKLKLDTFGHDALVLHEHDIRKGNGLVGRLGKEGREKFLDQLTAILEATSFTVFAIVIDKQRHRAKYINPEHPYHMAMQFGLERLFNFLGVAGQDSRLTHVVCETRGAKEDKELELAFRRVCDGANYQGKKFGFELVMVDKKANCEGLQIADLTARPIGLSVLRPGQVNRAMDVITKKLARNAFGSYKGVGLKVFP